MNLATLTDDDLDALRVSVLTEQERRRMIAEAPAYAEALAIAYATAVGRKPGDPYQPVTGAHDAYPKGSIVTHNGKEGESLTPANVGQPGVSGWRELVAEGYPAWVQPTGAHDAYNKEDRVSFNGGNYESVIDGNTYSPAVYPAGWKTV